MIILEIFYTLVAFALAVYGFNALILTIIRARNHSRDRSQNRNEAQSESGILNQRLKYPQVTIQLPVYNERYVVRRLIDAAAAQDYPHDLLEIQVLDDSDDVTSDIIAQAIIRYQTQGIKINHIRRSERHGYKGGALAHGMKSARGEFIAIFDADFIPPPDFLKSTIPHFYTDTEIGCIQTRWEHTNPESSWLTRVISSGIDGHFVIEQETRSSSQLFLNFNGTCGVWRKNCIQDAGGWQSDTITEDLDLSYRAQMRGWRIKYLPHVRVPGELPVHINAFKRQQFRWAKGSIQTARKLLGSLWASSKSPHVKIAGSIHLTHYMVHPLMLLNLILILPVVHVNSPILKFVPLLATAALGPWLMYWIAGRDRGLTYKSGIQRLLMLSTLGMGLTWNNTRAVIEALAGKQSSFLRTPKFNLHGNDNVKGAIAYTLPLPGGFWIELLSAIYAIALLGYIWYMGQWILTFWLLLYAGGFTAVTVLTLTQSFQLRAARRELNLNLNRRRNEAGVLEN